MKKIVKWSIEERKDWQYLGRVVMKVVCVCVCVCVCVSCSVVSESLDPWTVACMLLVHGFLKARILQWVAIPFSRESFWPRDQTRVSCTGAESPGKPDWWLCKDITSLGNLLNIRGLTFLIQVLFHLCISLYFTGKKWR